MGSVTMITRGFSAARAGSAANRIMAAASKITRQEHRSLLPRLRSEKEAAQPSIPIHNNLNAEFAESAEEKPLSPRSPRTLRLRPAQSIETNMLVLVCI